MSVGPSTSDDLPIAPKPTKADVVAAIDKLQNIKDKLNDALQGFNRLDICPMVACSRCPMNGMFKGKTLCARAIKALE